MKALFWRTLKDRKFSLLIYCAIGMLLVFMYVSIFETMKDQAAKFNQLSEVYPPEILKAFGIESMGAIFSKLERFLAVEQYAIMWPIMAIALLVSWAGSAIAGEVEKGTIEILLSQPISRIKIFFSKYLSGLLAAIIFTFTTVFVAVPVASAFGIDYQAKNFVAIALAGFLFCLAILSISMFFSTIFSEKGKVYFLSTGIVVAMYVLNIVANLKENFKDLQYASFFHYFDPNKVLVDGRIDNLSYAVFLGTAVVFTLLGAWIFAKRDITT